MERSSAERSEEFPQWGFPCTKEQFEAALNQTEDYVRKKPAQSLLFAFIAGYIWNRLPISRIFGGLFRLVVVALRPAILIYGATKLYQAAADCSCSHASSPEHESPRKPLNP
jgi:hypothetical protein